MKDDNKTKKQLIHELTELRSQNAALKKSENAEKFRSLVENIRDVIYELDSQGVVLYISPSIRDMLGYDSAEMVGKSFIDLSHKEDKSSLEEWFSELRKGREYPSEYRVIKKSGDLIWARTKTRPIMEDGRFKGAQGILIDVTEQKRAEEALRESEKKYRLLVDNMVDVITIMDMNLRFTYVSPSIMRLLGYTVEEAMAQTLEQVLTSKSMQIIGKVFEEEMKLEAGGAADPSRNRILELEEYRKDGSVVWIENHLSFIRDQTQKPVSIISLSHDITERKREREALHHERDRAQSYLDTVETIIVALNTEGRITTINRKGCQLFGCEEDELIGQLWFSTCLPQSDGMEEVFSVFLSLLSGEKKVTEYFENDIITRNGEIRRIAWHNTLLRDEQGRVIGTLSSGEDITERKRVEESLRESQQIIEGIINAIPVRVFWKDQNLVYLGCNAVFARDAGFADPKDIIGKDDYQMGWHDQAELYRSDDRQVIESGCSKLLIEEPQTTPERNTITLLTSKIPLRSPNGEISGVLGTYMDITDRKRVERSLRESEESYRNLFENANEGIFVGLDSKIVLHNPKTTMILGYSTEDLVSKPLNELIHPDDRHIVIDSFVRQIKGENPQIYEFRIIQKDGNVRWVVLNSVMINWKGRPASLNFLSDITERKRAENALRTSEERFRKIFEEAHQVGIVITSPSFVFEKANPAFCRMMGYSADQLRSMTFANLTHPDHLKLDMENVKKVGRGEIPFYQTEKRYINKSGEVLWGNLIVSSIRDEHGALQYYLSMVIDITKQKKAVELMLEATDKYQDLAESISDVFFAMDKNLRYTYWNEASEKLTGIQAEKALGKSLIEIFPDNEARKQLEEMYLLTIETKKAQHLTLNFPGDELLVHEISSYPTIEGVSVFVKDVTGRKQAERQLQDTLENLRKAFGSIIQVMVSAVEIKDPYTAGHQTRSADLARAIATEMGLSQEKIEGIRMAGSIHDIGKLSIPPEILSKPTKLSEIEFSLIKEHAQKGYEILKNVESPWPLAEIVYQHHERMNGCGYPRGLAGDDILIEARILAVADVVEAIASHRPYRPALGIDKALEEISQNKGILYEPEVVDVCFRLFKEKGFKLE